jgi:predicted DNA-binding transcriptional regulator AlpA
MGTTKTPGDERNLGSTDVDALEVPPAAVDAAGAGRFCGVSRSQWWKLHSAGKVPLPVYLGSKAPRWLLDELRAWLEAGCPTRQEWQRMRGECR